MASSTSNAQPRTVLIHVVSPNAEVGERLVFQDVPITETVADLKRRIQDAVSTKPVPERQRIIYRGRAIIQQDVPLQSVLGSESLIPGTPCTFHLVLTPTNVAPNTSPARQDGLHQPMGLPALPINPLAPHGLHMPPPTRPASTSQLPEGGLPPMTHNMGINHATPFLPHFMQQAGPVGVQFQITQQAWPVLPMGGPPGALNFAQRHPLRPSMDPSHHVNQSLQAHEAMHRAAHQALVDGQGNNQLNQQPQTQTPGTTDTASTLAEARNDSSPRSLDPVGSTSRSQSRTRSLHQSPAMQAALRQNQLQNMHLDQIHNTRDQMSQLRNALGIPSQSPALVLSATAQTVYLVQSPQGPEALLLSPSGTFATPGHSMAMHSPFINPSLSTMSINTHISRAPTPTPTVPAPAVTVAQGQQQPQNAQQNQQNPRAPQQEDQVDDIFRILLPMGGHLWLLVRLIGFVYLFSGGRGWRNTIMLGTIAAIFFLAQIGLFNPLVRNVWRPVREHVEGIINTGHPRPRAVAGQEPTPQQIADRLVEERQANEHFIRRMMRRAERSVILFAASLIPGVGENQVRARETAEREQREAEQAAERVRLEAEAQAQQAEADKDKKGDEMVPDSTKEVDGGSQVPNEKSTEASGVD